MNTAVYHGLPLVSVIIPARNEERHLASAVRSVTVALGHELPHEIIVIDHASSDDTASLARRLRALVIEVQSAASIAALRNRAASEARGEVLVFLDADVTVDQRWGERMRQVVTELASHLRVITGSWCMVPVGASWIERSWFDRRIPRDTHVGSGHMVMSRRFFEELGGFDDRLATGEDYDLCRRAIDRGGKVKIDPQLKAVHHGFPSTMGAFVRREVWHGEGDWRTLRTFLQSKVALASTAFAVMNLALAVGVLSANWRLVAIGAVGVIGLVLATLEHLFELRRSPPSPRLLLLGYLYLGGRSLSPLLAAWRFGWSRR